MIERFVTDVLHNVIRPQMYLLGNVYDINLHTFAILRKPLHALPSCVSSKSHYNTPGELHRSMYALASVVCDLCIPLPTLVNHTLYTFIFYIFSTSVLFSPSHRAQYYSSSCHFLCEPLALLVPCKGIRTSPSAKLHFSS